MLGVCSACARRALTALCTGRPSKCLRCLLRSLRALGYGVAGLCHVATAARAGLQESFFKLPFELSASVDALVKAGMEKLKESTLIGAAPSAGQDDSSDDEQVWSAPRPPRLVCLFASGAASAGPQRKLR